jgi:hypothetical protein
MARAYRLVMILGVAVMLSIRVSADVKVSEAEAKQAAVEKPTPVISTTARQLKVSGRVELSVTIDPSGMVADVGSWAATRSSPRAASQR